MTTATKFVGAIAIVTTVALGWVALSLVSGPSGRTDQPSDSLAVDTATTTAPMRDSSGADSEARQAEASSAAPLQTGGERERTSNETAPNPAAASEYFRRADELTLCTQSRTLLEPEQRKEREERYWRWLPEELAARERMGLDDVLKRAVPRCATVPNASSNEIAEISETAGKLGHPLAKLKELRFEPSTPDVIQESRALLDDVLRTGRLDDIARLGESMPILGREMADVQTDEALWQLVACDLGMPCSRNTPAWDRVCIDDVAACGVEHLERHALDSVPERLIPYFQLRRAQLAERIRRRDYEAVLRELFPPKP